MLNTLKPSNGLSLRFFFCVYQEAMRGPRFASAREKAESYPWIFIVKGRVESTIHVGGWKSSVGAVVSIGTDSLCSILLGTDGLVVLIGTGPFGRTVVPGSSSSVLRRTGPLQLAAVPWSSRTAVVSGTSGGSF